jgi:AraC-like DNA-binding protein
LSPFVAGFAGYRERATGAVSRVEPASSHVALIVSFGDTLDVSLPDRDALGSRHHSFVAGMHAGPAATRYVSRQHGLQVDLTPRGVVTLLGVPGSELASDIVSLDAFDARLGSSLADQLASSGSWQERFAVLDRRLLALAADGPRVDPAVNWAWDELVRTAGSHRIRDLVDASGWSHRRFTSRFRNELGVGPKTAARILRFEAAGELIRDGVALAAAAAHCGFADQSHLTREFTGFAGTTPATYAEAG